MSYVTGTHNMKFGYQGGVSWSRKTPTFVGQQISYRFNNGVPNQLIAARRADVDQQPHAATTAFYVQDQWTRSRLTLQGGLRYEHALELVPGGRERRHSTRIGSAPRSPSRAPTASRATTTSRRAWAPPTTCSATARRRSR